MNILNHTFKFRTAGEWQDVSTIELFKDKKVVLFGLPGAFTPTCSSKQLPGYEESYNKFKDLGIDEVYCISVNDAFVMNAWADAQGFGLRSWRYSAIIDNEIITYLAEEPGINNFSNDSDPYIESTPEKIITYLELQKQE